MKKKLMLSFIAVVAAAGSLMAQTAQEMSTPAGKTKAAVTTIAMSMNITEAQRVNVLNILTAYYNSTAATTVASEEGQQAAKTRNEKLKETFTAAQFEQYQKNIEAKL